MNVIIQNKYISLFDAVIVHGSFSSNEIIPYSDFDGLLILKNDDLNSKLLKGFIKKTNQTIRSFDPLQHHSWFILKRSDLTNYDETYFPLELFKYSKLIYPEYDFTFEVKLKENIDFLKPFDDLSSSILNKIKRKNYKKNAFHLKSYLSQIMLLPCLYLQAKNKKGVYKKNSFSDAENDFDKSYWEVITISSNLRITWSYKINYIQKFIAKSDNYIINYFYKNYLAPSINGDIGQKINHDFNKLLICLINQMRENLKNY